MSPQPYLWYGAGELNFNPSFNDFVPFGGYTTSQSNTPFLKKIAGSQTLFLCNNPNQLAFVDMTWIPFT